MPGPEPAPGSEQITRICTIAGWFEFGLAAVQIGGSARGYPAGSRRDRPVMGPVRDRPDLYFYTAPPRDDYPHNAADRVEYRSMTDIGMPFGQPLQMQEVGCV